MLAGSRLHCQIPSSSATQTLRLRATKRIAASLVLDSEMLSHVPCSCPHRRCSLSSEQQACQFLFATDPQQHDILGVKQHHLVHLCNDVLVSA